MVVGQNGKHRSWIDISDILPASGKQVDTEGPIREGADGIDSVGNLSWREIRRSQHPEAASAGHCGDEFRSR
jgi:hypothetical protein